MKTTCGNGTRTSARETLRGCRIQFRFPALALLSVWVCVRAASGATCVPLPAGAVAWWRAETNFWDSASVNDLKTGATCDTLMPEILFVAGRVGRAFAGALCTYLVAPPSPELDVGGGAGLTVEGWVKPNFLSGLQSLLAWNDGSGNAGAVLACNGTSLEGHFTDTNATPVRRILLRSAPGVLTNNVWKHVALTFDHSAGLARLWVNGSSVAQTNLGTFRPQTRAPVYLGRWLPSNGEFNGALDEFTIYNRALAAAELQAILAADAVGKCAAPLVCAPSTADLVGWWRFESNALDHVDSNAGVLLPFLEFVHGAVGQSLFLSRGGFVRVPVSGDLDVGRGEGFTVEGWMIPSSSTTQPMIAWSSETWKGPTGTHGVSFQRAATNGLVADLVDTNGVSHVITSPQLAPLGGWQHVALTYDQASGVATLYRQGLAVAQTNLGAFTPRTDLPLHFGYQPYGSGRFYGSLDEIALHGRALTAQEIKAIVKARHEGRCKAPPAILALPEDLRVTVGADAQFAIVATGNPRLRYQWFKDGTPLAGATGATLTLTNVQEAQAGNYAARVTNWFGAVTSSNAVLRVNHPPVADASATATPALAPLHGPATVVLDGSRSTDPDSDPLTYAWWSDGHALGTGVVAAVQLPAGQSAIALVVDDGLAQSTNRITLEIFTPAQAMERLKELVNAEVLRRQPLLATLEAALAAVRRDDVVPTINQLHALQNEVRAQVADPALADRLMRSAEDIIDALRGSVAGVAEPVKIHGAKRQSDGHVRLKFSGGSGRVFVVEASTDLSHWQVIGAARRVGENLFEFEDMQAARFPGRFYRVVVR